jgi:hypothetical protein
MGRDGVSERVPIGPAEADLKTPGRRHQQIDVAAVTVEVNPCRPIPLGHCQVVMSSQREQ